MKKLEVDESTMERWMDTLVAGFDTSDLQEIVGGVVEEMEQLSSRYSDEEEG